MRAELAQPEMQVVTTDVYNQLFTMHGSIMMFLFLGPFAFGLANYIVPLQIGAPDMAFPRLNALSYWLYLGGGLTMVSGFLTAEGAPAFGWFAYTPLSGGTYSPSIGGELWLIGLLLTGFSAVFTAVNLITTIVGMRAPGMTMFRVPIFTWNMLVTSGLVLIAFPVLTAASVLLLSDRHFGTHVFDLRFGGSPLLWQHLFWFFGHPEVYILALPFFGVITEVLPVFSRRPVFGYKGLVFATLSIAALSTGVWAHHMFVTGAVLLPFFQRALVPDRGAHRGEVLRLDRHHVAGPAAVQDAPAVLHRLPHHLPARGLTGVLLASPPVDFQVSDSYFVVAHMHYVLFGGSVFALFAGVYYWFPKFTGRMLGERLGQLHVFSTFVGFNLTFLVQHQLGLSGMPRRVADYRAEDGFTTLNVVSSVGSFLLGISTLVFLVNVAISLRRGREAGDDPWGGHTLEWAAPSPPPPGNFTCPLPPIRSNRPVFDAAHPGAGAAPDPAGARTDAGGEAGT